MTSHELKILTFNVWDLPLTFKKSRRERLKAIANYLKTVTADIIFLQEVWFNDTRRLLSESLTQKFYEPSLIRNNNTFSNHHGGLMIFSHQPLSAASFHQFFPVHWPISEWIGNKGWLTTLVTLPTGIIRLINTHFNQPRPTVRHQQFQQLMSYLKNNQSHPIILAGDFNQSSLSEQSDYKSGLNLVGLYEPGGHTQKLLQTYRRENSYARTWSNHTKRSEQIDYIFISKQNRWKTEVKSYEAFHLDPPLSDHDPLLLTLHII